MSTHQNCTEVCDRISDEDLCFSPSESEETQPNLAEQDTNAVFVSVEINGEKHKKPFGVPTSSSAVWVHLSGEGVLDPARKLETFIFQQRHCFTACFSLNKSNKLPTDLSCYNDYNKTINCVWNSTHEHQDHVCKIDAERPHLYDKLQNCLIWKLWLLYVKLIIMMWFYSKNYYNSSCQLHPVDSSNPRQKNCTLLFKKYRVSIL